MTSGNDTPSLLEQVERRGSLGLLTRNGASSYFIGPEGDTGPEYELAREFAEFLGVDLEVMVADSYPQLAEWLDAGNAELIGANLTRTPTREQRFNFSPGYSESEVRVVYKRGEPRPRSPEDLVGRRVATIAGTSYEERLEAMKETVPDLEWQARDQTSIDELFQAIADGNIDATLVDANIFRINRSFFPAVKHGFTLPGTRPQAWAFRRGDDDSLVQQSRLFLTLAKENGTLAALQSRFFDDQRAEDTVMMYTFLRRVRERLPDYLRVFQDVAAEHDLDWRLLAAIGYQESHWDPLATSPTGVRGMMMLTQRTARQLGIDDRLDPLQSIEGGARYYRSMWSRVPTRIQEPDRTWMALAAYNMGMGHLEDARVLTQRQGGDPDLWSDIDPRLPLLSQENHYQSTRYGYARGREAQRYVSNIRRYYDSLVWMDTHSHPLLAADGGGQEPWPASP